MIIHHSILLRYHEVALKGGNRRWFEDRLTLNACKLIRRALGRDTSIEIKRYHGRITLETQWNMQTQAALERVFGLSSFSPMRRVTTDKLLYWRPLSQQLSNLSILIKKFLQAFESRLDEVIRPLVKPPWNLIVFLAQPSMMLFLR